MNTASEGDGIPAELLQILKDCYEMAALNMLATLKSSAVHRTGKGQFSF